MMGRGLGRPAKTRRPSHGQKENSDKGEEQLWLDIYKNSGVLLTPGVGFMHQKKGCYRLVFTAVTFDHLQVAMDRMITYLGTR